VVCLDKENPTGLTVFEVTLPGFDGSTDETEDLIKWIKAPDVASVANFIDQLNITGCMIEKLDNQNVDFVDGVEFFSEQKDIV
jgi:hypothetical protein